MPSQATFKRRQYLVRLRRRGSIQCGICSMPIRHESELTIDHIIPKAKGGSNRVDNLQPAHKACNAAKGSELPSLLKDPEEIANRITDYDVFGRKPSVDRKAIKIARHRERAYSKHVDGRYTARRGFDWRRENSRKNLSVSDYDEIE